MWRVVTFFLILTTHEGLPQTRLNEIDRKAISFKSEKNISLEQLTVMLTRDLRNDYEKTRVIYRWITNNIVYDCELYHKIKDKRKGKSLKFNKKTHVYKVYKKKKSICGGYANLMKYMCDIAYVKCEIIEGVAKGSAVVIGDRKPGKHAWNAISIDGKWYMCDPTWGSGYTDIKVTTFTKSFRDQYFLVDPKYFILSHYPDNPAWKLTDSKLKFHEFANLPIIAGGFYRNRINNFYPRNGVVKAAVGDTIEFILSSNLENGLRYISLVLLSKDMEEIKGKGNSFDKMLEYTDLGYKYNYVVYREGRYKVVLVLNGKSTLIYDFYVEDAKPQSK